MDIVLRDFVTGIEKTVSIRVNSKPVQLCVGENVISLMMEKGILEVSYNGERVAIKGRKTLNTTIPTPEQVKEAEERAKEWVESLKTKKLDPTGKIIIPNPKEGMYSPEERPLNQPEETSSVTSTILSSKVLRK